MTVQACRSNGKMLDMKDGTHKVLFEHWAFRCGGGEATLLKHGDTVNVTNDPGRAGLGELVFDLVPNTDSKSYFTWREKLKKLESVKLNFPKKTAEKLKALASDLLDPGSSDLTYDEKGTMGELLEALKDAVNK